jgi:arginyl-tRNA synthetase
LKNSAERQFRLQLTYAVSVIIKEGLSLLGIETLERM